MIELQLAEVAPIELEIEQTPCIDYDVGEYLPVVYTDVPTFGGPYEVTPTNQEQVLQTNGKVMSNDVIIGPIPNNYGLITWDGTTLTVS